MNEEEINLKNKREKNLKIAVNLLKFNKNENKYVGESEINRQFKKLSLKNHPDKYKVNNKMTEEEAEENQKKLNAARDFILNYFEKEKNSENKILIFPEEVGKKSVDHISEKKIKFIFIFILSIIILKIKKIRKIFFFIINAIIKFFFWFLKIFKKIFIY